MLGITLLCMGTELPSTWSLFHSGWTYIFAQHLKGLMVTLEDQGIKHNFEKQLHFFIY